MFRVVRVPDGPVALKVFRLQGTPQEQAYPRTWMPADWRIWRDLVHPHAVPVRDYGETDETVYVATKWIDGPSLRAVLDRRGALDAAEIRRLAQQLASVLDAAASVRLLHPDIKPENVLFASADSTEHAYVTDFGAGQLAAWRAEADRSRTFRGNLEYAAPEQVKGGFSDRRSMVYSLGSLLYETLTGAAPYGGHAAEALAREELQDAPPHVEGAPAEVDRVFAKALAPNRGERYATCTELADALCAVLDVAPAQHPARTTRRRRVVRARHAAAAAAAAAVAAIAAASLYAMGGSDPSQTADGEAAPGRGSVTTVQKVAPKVKAERKTLRAAPVAKPKPARVTRAAKPKPKAHAATHPVAPAPRTVAATPARTRPAVVATPVKQPVSSPPPSRPSSSASTHSATTEPADKALPPPPPALPPTETTPPPPPPPP
jgi:serine/threonine-protein kinase